MEKISTVAASVRRYYPHPPEWKDTLQLSRADRSLFKAAFDESRTVCWNFDWSLLRICSHHACGGACGCSGDDRSAECQAALEKELSKNREDAYILMVKCLLLCLFNAIHDGFLPDEHAKDAPCVVFSKIDGVMLGVTGLATVGVAEEVEIDMASVAAAAQENENQKGGADSGAASASETTSAVAASASETTSSNPSEGEVELYRVHIKVFAALRKAVFADAFLGYSVLQFEAMAPAAYRECSYYLKNKFFFMGLVFPSLCRATASIVQQRDFLCERDAILSKNRPGAAKPSSFDESVQQVASRLAQLGL